MRSCVLFVYWALLLISAVSSGLLFLIVASDTQTESARTENTQAADPSFQSEKNETYGAYGNITLNYDDLEENFESTISNAETQDTVEFKTSQDDHYHQEEATTVSASFETVTNDNAQMQEVDILAESLTQQPNLSQGISETGQAVVLTLVDTAAAELQSLAEPKINRELSSRSSVKNSSLLSSGVGQPELKEQLPTTQIPPPPVVDDTTERPNDTEVEQDDVLLLKKISEEAPEVVVIVRAEQKINDLELGVEDEVGHVISDEIPRVDDAFTTAPELNDSAARAQLVGGSRDETAAVILDGLVSSGPTDPHEDIPSFSEWAQKRLEEAEKKKTHPNASVQTPGGPGRSVSGMKVRSKNYASPDCGAKIVAVNPEARGAKNVLVSTRDEYMLNACTSRVWFVVELCEAIQAKKIELANFELFSSSPKDFSVYVSDRFPTRDWSPVGQFTAKDVKDVQSFALHPHFFGKFIKVELQSHYGSEHFCPVSLFRAYGTSEFEVLETETEDQILQEANASEDDDEDSDEEEPLDSEDGDPSRNLFGSARDAVLSIVKKAAEVLVKSSDLTGNNITEIQHSIDGDNILDDSYTSCMTPRYTILCGNCTDQKFASVFQLVSCRDRQLDDLLRIDLVNRTLRRGKLCALYGVEIDSFCQKEEADFAEDKRDDATTTRFDLAQDLQTSFLASVFKPEYIAALCNVLATKERKVVMNTSYEISTNASEDVAKEDLLSIKDTDQNNEVVSHHQVSATCTLDSDSPVCKTAPSRENRRRLSQDVNEEVENFSATSIENSISTESLASQIKPTKTLSKEDMRKESSVPILEPSKEPTEETLQAEALTTVAPSLNLPTPTLKIAEDLPPIAGTSVEMVSQTVTNVPSVNVDSQETGDTFASDTDNVEVGAQVKTEKSEGGELEGRQAKDLSEQDVKLSSQDHLTLDTLFSDLKDFEGDAANMQNGASSASSVAQPTASTAPQKESVFLRLSNRIKALERNMSLSGQYLEELSRRYKKQVEEMQRSFERAVSAMSEESRKGEEREAKRVEEIAVLREEIAVLSKSVQSLLHDQDSWQSRISAIGQHALLIWFEVMVITLFLSYCRRTSDLEEDEKAKDARAEGARRKSAENFGAQDAARRTKKRRPSEIASHINSTYHELMIDERCHETKKERKKKRKKEAVAAGGRTAGNADVRAEGTRHKSGLNALPGGATLPSRRASSIDPPRPKESQDTSGKRPESAPETSSGWFDDQQAEIIERIAQPARPRMEPDRKGSSDLSHRGDEFSESNSSSGAVDRCLEGPVANESSSRSKSSSFRAGGILKGAKLSSPSFMKTAISSRSKRRLLSNSERWENWNQDSEHSNSVSVPSTPTGPSPRSNDSANGSAAHGLIEESDESRSSSATRTPSKKEKKSTGLRKMDSFSVS
ncbi:PREDICTED: SUN domain-containing ossification factor isoform X2 [Dinoponera quadriceps]|uniref:SUN domain-containing ossification factor isoform X2 n=1 Tax=Dinoponera quadriceps TaxID=609295 RepID=A0A6P3X214_DINQU|nr:PREDICTED: SUN domain-containing ossification factor isoform X2 [Dinoponera quadriceps]